MTSLITLSRKFEKRLDYVSEGFRRAQRSRPTDIQRDYFFKLEGLISTLWQSWCGFIRSAILESSLGSNTSQGVLTTSQYCHLSMDQLRNVATKLARNQGVPAQINPIAGFHAEPTWGDISKAIAIVNGISPTNANSIATGIGVITLGKDVQTVRNAIAHYSTDRLADIRAMQVRYLNTAFRHPSEVAFWTEPSTGSSAWAVWVDEYRASASQVVR